MNGRPSLQKTATVILSMALATFWAVDTGRAETENMDPLKTIFLVCRHVGGPTPADDLRSYAEKNGLSDAEMSEKLVAFVKTGLSDDADRIQQRMGGAALYGLAQFGGERERAFVWDIMTTSDNQHFQDVAIEICIRMMPDKWEEVVREVATNPRFSSYDRFLAYEGAFLVGSNASPDVRNRVAEVLSEFAEREPGDGYQERLRQWSAELQAR